MASSQAIDTAELISLGLIFRNLKFPRHACINMARRMQHLEKHHGTMFLVTLLRKLAHDLITPGTGVIKKRKDGSWWGDFRPIWTTFHKDRNGKARALAALKVYGRWIKEPSHEDFVNFYETLSKPGAPKETVEEFIPYLMSTITSTERYLSREAEKHADFVKLYPGGPKKSPVGGLKHKAREVISPKEHVDSALQHCPGIMMKHYTFMSKVIMYPKVDLPPLRKADCVGTITALNKDRGMKIRFVANPFMVLQLAMSRLKAGLRSYLEALPESCVFDQEKGRRWVRDKFKEGRMMTSLDIKSCSDHLPAIPQFALLRELFPGLLGDIDLFQDVSCARYLLSDPTDPIKVRWMVGQPLGTDPSFYSFTIFLVHLLRLCGGSAKTFRIIGDDVVLDHEIYPRVVAAYELLHVPINWHKSIIGSPYIAEFGGRYIDSFGSLRAVKASPMNIKSDPLGMIRQYGFRGLRLVPFKSIRPVLAAVALLPEPIGFGKPDRIFPCLPPEVIEQLMSPRVKPVKRLFPIPTPGLHEFFREFPSSVEQRTVEVVTEQGGNRLFVLTIRDFIRIYLLPFVLGDDEKVCLLQRSALTAYRGVGVWLYKITEPFDRTTDNIIKEFNELLDVDPTITSVPLFKRIHRKLEQESQRKLPVSIGNDVVVPEHVPIQTVRSKWKLLAPYIGERVSKFLLSSAEIIRYTKKRYLRFFNKEDSPR